MTKITNKNYIMRPADYGGEAILGIRNLSYQIWQDDRYKIDTFHKSSKTKKENKANNVLKVITVVATAIASAFTIYKLAKAGKLNKAQDFIKGKIDKFKTNNWKNTFETIKNKAKNTKNNFTSWFNKKASMNNKGNKQKTNALGGIGSNSNNTDGFKTHSKSNSQKASTNFSSSSKGTGANQNANNANNKTSSHDSGTKQNYSSYNFTSKSKTSADMKTFDGKTAKEIAEMYNKGDKSLYKKLVKLAHSDTNGTKNEFYDFFEEVNQLKKELNKINS